MRFVMVAAMIVALGVILGPGPAPAPAPARQASEAPTDSAPAATVAGRGPRGLE